MNTSTSISKPDMNYWTNHMMTIHATPPWSLSLLLLLPSILYIQRQLLFCSNIKFSSIHLFHLQIQKAISISKIYHIFVSLYQYQTSIPKSLIVYQYQTLPDTFLNIKFLLISILHTDGVTKGTNAARTEEQTPQLLDTKFWISWVRKDRVSITTTNFFCSLVIWNP